MALERVKTTFWSDFTIADMFGKEGIEDTYKRAFKEWKNDIRYITELYLVLNWKIWDWHGKGDDVKAKLYNSLWDKLGTWILNNVKKQEELEFFYRVTD